MPWIRVSGAATAGLALLLALAGVGCVGELSLSSADGDGPTPRIEVTPDVLEFGALEAGTSLAIDVSIANVGDAALSIGALALYGPDDFEILDDVDGTAIQPGESILVAVSYSPVSFVPVDGVLHVLSDDPTDPDVAVSLVAEGLASVLQIDPVDYTFEEHEAGCEQSKTIVLHNGGDEDLTLSEVQYVPTSDELAGTWDFENGVVLAPGGDLEVTVTYAPVDDVADTGYLYVFLDESENPSATARQNGTAVYAPLLTETFPPAEDDQVDILWVVDNSCSMSDQQEILANNLSAILDVLDDQGLDYRMAVVTTDDASFQGPVPIMDAATPDLEDAFAQAVRVGTYGSGHEQGLLYGTAAVTPPMTDPGGGNEGFLREYAHLRMFIVSDEDDGSPEAPATYVAELWGLKPDTDMVMLAGATGGTSGCHDNGVEASPAPAYEQAFGMTGGVSVDICDPTWVAGLASLPWEHLGCTHDFPLSEPALEHTISVSVDGVSVSDGWTWDAATNTVSFGDEFGCGSAVVIDYVPVGGC